MTASLRLAARWALLLTLGCVIACDDDETPPASASTSEENPTARTPNEHAPTEEPLNERAPTQEPQSEEPTSETGDTPDPCPLVVLDPRPPLRVRGGPSSDSAALGHLDNGTIVRSVERRDGYVRITEPVAGWVFHEMLMRSCDAPPALPALPLGEHTYLLLPSAHGETPVTPGTALPPPPGDPEFITMRFSFRDPRPTATPTPITLVSASGSCQVSASRRVLLVGTCPTSGPSDYRGDYSTAIEALEVASCPALYPNVEQLDHVAAPLMVGLVGHHDGARIEPWAHSEAPLTPTQRSIVERRIRRIVAEMEPQYRAEHTPEMPQAMDHFEGSPWSWVYLEDDHLLFRGDTLMDTLDMTADFPKRVRAQTDLLVGIGSWGHHGYGFYMFPDEARRGLARESGFPTFSCGPN